MTLDGKIASASGKSKWITGEAAREQVHRMRHEMTGIMVGVDTVIADDPMLNCRLPQTKDPVRIVCDTTLRIPLSCRPQRSRRPSLQPAVRMKQGSGNIRNMHAGS